MTPLLPLDTRVQHYRWLELLLGTLKDICFPFFFIGVSYCPNENLVSSGKGILAYKVQSMVFYKINTFHRGKLFLFYGLWFVFRFFCLFVLWPFSHQQFSQKYDKKPVFFILAYATQSLILEQSPPQCLFDLPSLCRCASPLGPTCYLFLSFPFPLIVQIKSTLPQPVSHGNLLTSSHDTLFLFLHFLFFSFPPSLPQQTHIPWPQLIPSFSPLCCLPSFSP